MNPKKARLKDIASLCGVSIGTVDRVLHERGEVAEKTRRKVLKVAKELNYTPNLMAQALKTKKRYNIVTLLPVSTDDNPFWSVHPKGIHKAMEELMPFPVFHTQVSFDMLNEEDFQEKTKIVLKLDPDGVILAPIFKSESIAFCSRLSRKNVPFVFIDGYISESDFLAYVGEDIFQSGRVAGQLADIITPVSKDILILNIARNLQNIHHLNNRTEGFLSYFPESGMNRGHKIKLNIPDTYSETIKSSLRQIFKKYPGIATIFITGSKSYKIASYLISTGKRKISVIGYDLLKMNVELLKSGNIKFLIGQRPDEQTYRAVKKLFEFLSFGKVPDKMDYLPVDVITSENVDLFIKTELG